MQMFEVFKVYWIANLARMYDTFCSIFVHFKLEHGLEHFVLYVHILCGGFAIVVA